MKCNPGQRRILQWDGSEEKARWGSRETPSISKTERLWGKEAAQFWQKEVIFFSFFSLCCQSLQFKRNWSGQLWSCSSELSLWSSFAHFSHKNSPNDIIFSRWVWVKGFTRIYWGLWCSGTKEDNSARSDKFVSAVLSIINLPIIINNVFLHKREPLINCEAQIIVCFFK